MALNQLKYDQLETGSIYPITASYAISSSAGSGGGTSLITGSTYPITSSWSNNSISSSYSLNSTTSSYSNTSTSASYSRNSSTASYLDPISQSLIPSTGSIYSLGSPTNKWKDLYVSTGSIYIGETVLSTSGSTLFANESPIVTLNTASGQIEIIGITASLSASYATNAGLFNNTSSTVFATTGSNNFNGNQTVQGNITVVGSLIAQQYIVSSSVSYFTSSNFDGSTKFGDTDSDTHQFTGSLRSPNITGSLLGTSSFSNNSTSASYSLTSSVALNALTSSYINVATNAVSSSYAGTASISISSSFSTTSSYNLNSISSSYSLTASFAANAGSSLTTGSTYPITSSWANNAISSSYANVAATATSANTANSATSASYALTASFALNASGGGSGTVTGSVNYIAKFTSGSSVGNSVIYESGSNIGIGTTSPNSKLNINSSGSLVSGSVVFSVEGTQGSLFSVDDNLSGSLMSVNDVSGLPILEVFSDDRLVVGTYNSNALVVTGSRVGIGTNVPIAKLQVSGNISGSSFTSSVSNGVGFLGTSSFSVTSSYALSALTASFALNASGGGGGSGTVTGSTNYISKFTSGTSVGNSVIYETGSNIGIGTTVPNSKLNINSSGSLVSGSVVFSVEGTQGSLFSVDDNLSGSLMSVNDVSGLPILEVFSDDRLVVGTYNSNALVVTGSRVGIGTNNPIAKLQVNGNISGSSFTGSVFGTSSWATNAISSSFSTTSATATSATSATSASYSTNAGTATSATSANTANSATSASYSLSSSYSVNSTTSTSSSFASTASYNLNSISSSFAATSSYNLNSISSSYSLTASFALNGGGGGTTLTTGSTYPITSSWATNAITASYALNSAGGGGSVQTGNIANQTILYNVTTSQDNVISGLNLSSNKWGVTVVEEWNSGSGDVYYSSSSLLMHFSGSNGSTTFTDSGPNNLTITSNNGATISTAQSKFNNSSGLFDGTNDYCTISNNSVFDFGAGDFTIEYWEYRTVSTLYKPVLSRNTSGYPPFMVGWSEFGNVNFFSSADGASWNVASAVSMGTITTNVWTHYAVTRNGNTFRTFQNGTQISTFTSTATLPAGSGTVLIGAYATPAYFFQGYIDELRITKGVARYTGSFTTQSIEFPNQLPQYETKYIGLVGGLNDSSVDYGVEKLSDSSLKIRKMTASGQPLSGSGALSASVDRVYVNVLDYTNVMVTSSYALTASYVLGGIQTGSISNQTILYNVTTSQDNVISGLNLSSNKWGVTVIEEWNSGSVPGDIFYSSCSLLMHFSGSDGSTTFVDNSSSPKSFTRYGNAQVSTVQSKFGGSSLYLDGTGDYITTTYTTTAFDWWTTDYTIECFIYPNNSSSLSTSTPILIGNADPGSGINYWSFGPNNNKQLSFYYFNGASIFVTSTETTVVINQWNHIAMTKNSTGIRLFINGVASVTSASVSGTPQSSVSYPLVIGQINLSSINAYVDELRITKGVARYTSSFTVPVSAFPDTQGTIPQYETKYIGLVGGLNDSNVDYGVEKLSDSSLKIRKMTASGQPLSGSGQLSASVDRVYVNVLNYKEVQTTAQSASYASTSSYVINAPSGESFHPFLLG
jgi:hypothetical protein